MRVSWICNLFQLTPSKIRWNQKSPIALGKFQTTKVVNSRLKWGSLPGAGQAIPGLMR
jgi:hypothetical protein